METMDIKTKDRKLASKAIRECEHAVRNVVNTLKEVVKNRGNEIVFKERYEFVANFEDCVLKRIFIKDDTLYIEYVEKCGWQNQLTINHFEHKYVTLCSFLVYAVSE